MVSRRPETVFWDDSLGVSSAWYDSHHVLTMSFKYKSSNVSCAKHAQRSNALTTYSHFSNSVRVWIKKVNRDAKREIMVPWQKKEEVKAHRRDK